MATNPPPNKAPRCVTFKCVKDLQRILECPICLLTPENSGQAHFCSNGHMICGNCRVGIQRCPVCQSEDLNGQNHLLKQVLAVIPKLCPFDGCDAEPKDDELEDHKKNCQFRKIDCLTHSRCGCNEKIPINSFFQHYEVRHKKITQCPEKTGHSRCNWALKEEDFNGRFLSWFPFSKSFDGETFLISLTKFNNLFHCQCFLLGTESDAKKYLCEISSNSIDFPNNTIKFTGDIISVDVKRTEYEKEDYVNNFSFTNTMARKLWNKANQNITFNVAIMKKLRQ